MEPILPSMNGVLHSPEPANKSTAAAWVYNPEDKLSSGLYPMGIEVHPDVLESTRKPMRHSSFAGPRYARVVQRPQRAQSFATRRDPFGFNGEVFPKLHPVSVPELPRSFAAAKYLKRSSSLNTQCNSGATLSRKYRAFSLNRNDSQIIEVDSLLSAISDHSLAEALTDSNFTRTVKESPISKVVLNAETSQFSSRDVYPRLQRRKGPAPLPPISAQSVKKLEETLVQTPLDNKIGTENKYTKDNSGDEIKDYCTCSENFEGKNNDAESTGSAPSSIRKEGIEDELNNESNDEIFATSTPKFSHNKDRGAQSPVYEVPNLPHISFIKEVSQNSNFINSLKTSNFANRSNSDKYNWKNLEQFFNYILEKSRNKNSSDCSSTNSSTHSSPKLATIHNSASSLAISHNNYEEAHKEVTENYAALIERLPTNEVQRNKIVLRVPSFKTTGCQTEAYRPIRRRASCAPGSYIPAAKIITPTMKRMSVSKGIEVQMNGMTCSSSSGYSSPDGDSKGSSPLHSGPPSPGSSNETAAEKKQLGRNVTIIEVNRSFGSCSEITAAPTRPPKPLRISQLSETYTKSQGTDNPSTEGVAKKDRSSTNLPILEDYFGIRALAEDVRLLTEAVNPVLVHCRPVEQTIPRIVDAIPKKLPEFAHMQGSRNADTTLHNDEKPHILRLNSLSLPRLHPQYPRYRLRNTRSRSPSPTDQNRNEDSNQNLAAESSTAAYLASLELLATHYRQQALANAKQLQWQQHFFDRHHPKPIHVDGKTNRLLHRINMPEPLEEASNSSAEEDNENSQC